MTSHIHNTIAIIGAFTLWSGLVVASDDAQSSIGKQENMETQYHRLLNQLDAAVLARNVNALPQLGKDIDRFPLGEEMGTQEKQKLRERKIELWLKLLNECDEMIDPEFDPNDVPQLNVAPPPGTGLSAGASPSAIKDPQLRQEYERAIRLNAEKAGRYHVQEKLRDCERNWSAKVTRYITSQYTTDESDVKELDRLVERYLSSKARKQQLKDLLRTK